MKFDLGITLQRVEQNEEAKQVLQQTAQEPDFAGKAAAKVLAKIQQNPSYG